MIKEKRTALLSAVFLVLMSFGFEALALFSGFNAYHLIFIMAFLPALSNLLLAVRGSETNDEEKDRKSAIVKSILDTAVIILLFALIALSVVFFVLKFGISKNVTMNFVYPSVLALMIVLSIVLDQWCQYSSGEDSFFNSLLKNLRTSFGVVRLTSVVALLANVLYLLNVYNFTQVLKIVIAVIFGYEVLMMTVSLVLSLFKKALFKNPDLSIPKPLALGKTKDLSLLSYLENNTGLSMKSLWSLMFIKKALPYALISACLVFWICTGITQVNSYQKGIVYRFGNFKSELAPGLHMTLPWPFDKVEIYDTDVVKEMTIGYVSTGTTDNLWTEKSGIDEYKLLLGGGNELVSLNLRINYKISDVRAYALSSQSPDGIVQATAYNVITETIISTDIDTLLESDRVEFSDSFAEKLISGIEKYETGIEIVSVVLESIHPPVEIAEVFQKLISAEITASKYIYEAKGLSEVTLADANRRYDASVNAAISDQYDKVAKAKSDVAKFMASLQADTDYSAAYRYYKYLEALKTAYGKSTLIIIGNGIDSSNIYFGTLWQN